MNAQAAPPNIKFLPLAVGDRGIATDMAATAAV